VLQAEAKQDGGRFRILREYATGGLGRVSVALDAQLNREVALKEIRSERALDQNSQSRFLREAEITGGLEHPGIVPVYALGQSADGSPYYAMRFVRGDSLARAIRQFHDAANDQSASQRKLAFRELLQRFTDVCHAIEYAHNRGVLHRDLKPDNIMLGKFGETLVVDWGLARTTTDKTPSTEALDEPLLRPQSGSDSAPTQMGQALGTPAYMSPEQAAGRLDQLGPATDVYSLGATLYHILTNQPPFQKNDDIASVLLRVEKGDFPAPRAVNPEIPAAVESICLKAMARSPEARYASPDTLASDVERWLADEPVSAHSESLAERSRRWIRSHQTLMTSTTAMILVAAVALGVSLTLLRGKNSELKELNRELDQKNAELTAQQLQIKATNKELDQKNSELTAKQLQIEAKNKELELIARQRQLSASEEAFRSGNYDQVLEQTDDLDLSEIHDEIGFRRALVRGEALVGLNRAVESRSFIGRLPDAPTQELKARHLLLQGDVQLFDDPRFGVQLVSEALDLGLADADAIYAQAIIAPDFDASIERLEQLVNEYPLHLRGQALLAMSHVLTGDRVAAREVSQFGLRLWPDHLSFQMTLFLVESINGNLEAARPLLSELQRKMPGDIAALNVVAETFALSRRAMQGEIISDAKLASTCARIVGAMNSVSDVEGEQLRVPPQMLDFMARVNIPGLMAAILELNGPEAAGKFFDDLRSVLQDGSLHLYVAMRAKERALREEALTMAVNTRSIAGGVRERALHELLLTSLEHDPDDQVPDQRFIDAALDLAQSPDLNPRWAQDIARVLSRSEEWRVGETALLAISLDDQTRDEALLSLYWNAELWGRFLDHFQTANAATQETWKQQSQQAAQQLATQEPPPAESEE